MLSWMAEERRRMVRGMPFVLQNVTAVEWWWEWPIERNPIGRSYQTVFEIQHERKHPYRFAALYPQHHPHLLSSDKHPFHPFPTPHISIPFLQPPSRPVQSFLFSMSSPFLFFLSFQPTDRLVAFEGKFSFSFSFFAMLIIPLQ